MESDLHPLSASATLVALRLNQMTRRTTWLVPLLRRKKIREDQTTAGARPMHVFGCGDDCPHGVGAYGHKVGTGHT